MKYVEIGELERIAKERGVAVYVVLDEIVQAEATRKVELSTLAISKGVSEEDYKTLESLNKVVQKEGWAIFESFGREDGFRIEKLYVGAIFKDDGEAMRFVLKKGIEGSDIHKDAIDFMVKYGNESEVRIILKSLVIQ